jgi:hypothetical protein
MKTYYCCFSQTDAYCLYLSLEEGKKGTKSASILEHKVEDMAKAGKIERKEESKERETTREVVVFIIR